MKLRILRLHEHAIQPTYATSGAAAFDLYALEVSGGGDFMTAICRTGWAFEIPEGYAMLIFSRSGHGFKNDVRLANCVGVIDSDYRGEVMVKLTKDKPWDAGETPHLFAHACDRVAQAMVVPVPFVEFVIAQQLSITERGENGFGSTGAA